MTTSKREILYCVIFLFSDQYKSNYTSYYLYQQCTLELKILQKSNPQNYGKLCHLDNIEGMFKLVDVFDGYKFFVPLE